MQNLTCRFGLLTAFFVLSFAHASTIGSRDCQELLLGEVRAKRLSLADVEEVIHRQSFSTLPSYDGPETRLFYPFGGVDVFTATRVGRSIRDIYSIQLHPFGDVERSAIAVAGMENSKIEYMLSAQAYGMLSSQQLRTANDRFEGLGALAVFEIEWLLRGRVLDIKYLRWSNTGWQEYDLDEATGTPDHGKIVFEYEGRMVNYYLIRADLSDSTLLPNQVYPVYLNNQIEAQKTAIGIPRLKELLGDQPYVSIVKAIHQASNRLASHFTQVDRMLQNSELIYVDNGIAEKESFPNHQVVRLGERGHALFGTGTLVVLKKSRP